MSLTLSIDIGIRNMCFIILERRASVVVTSAPIDKKTKTILANPQALTIVKTIIRDLRATDQFVII